MRYSNKSISQIVEVVNHLSVKEAHSEFTIAELKQLFRGTIVPITFVTYMVENNFFRKVVGGNEIHFLFKRNACRIVDVNNYLRDMRAKRHNDFCAENAEIINAMNILSQALNSEKRNRVEKYFVDTLKHFGYKVSKPITKYEEL